jgi:hypothetical protein
MSPERTFLNLQKRIEEVDQALARLVQSEIVVAQVVLDDLIYLHRPASRQHVLRQRADRLLQDRDWRVQPILERRERLERLRGLLVARAARAAGRDTCGYCGWDNGPIDPATGRGLSRQGWDCGYCGGN